MNHITKALRNWSFIEVVAFVFLGCYIFFQFAIGTAQPIEKTEINVIPKGVAESVPYVVYRDYRPIQEGKTHTYTWWATKSGEWRRFEEWDKKTGPGIQFVLPDGYVNPAGFAITQGSESDFVLQGQFQNLEAAYEAQTITDRIPLWRFMTTH